MLVFPASVNHSPTDDQINKPYLLLIYFLHKQNSNPNTAKMSGTQSSSLSSSSSSTVATLSIRLTGAAAGPKPQHSFAPSDRYITNNTLPSFHVSTRSTQAGKPWQLALARVLPSEARRLTSDSDAFIRYDDDLTLYSGEKVVMPIRLGPSPVLIIRGHKRGTLRGSVVMEKAGRTSYKFFHMSPIRRPLTDAENDRLQALMHKRGYRDSDDWRKELLFTVQKDEWKIGEDDEVIATEREGKLDVMDDNFEGGSDLLVACWACKNFVLEN